MHDEMNINPMFADRTVVVSRGRVEFFADAPKRIGFAMFMYCLNGSLTLTLNLEQIELSADSELIMLPESLVSLVGQSDDARVITVMIERSAFNDIIRPFEASFVKHLLTHPVVHHTKSISVMAQRLYEIMYYTGSESDNRFCGSIISNYLRSILLNIYGHVMPVLDEATSGLSRTEALFHRFKALILSGDYIRRDVEYYAQKLCISKSYLATVTKLTAKQTPKGIIDGHVVQAIKFRLVWSDDSLQQIADRMGFPDQSYLGRYFKHLTGTSPGKFRSSYKVVATAR